MRTIAIAAMLLSTSVGSPPSQTRPGKATVLEGTWVLETINSKPIPPARGETTLVVSADAYEQRQGAQVAESGRLTVKPAKVGLNVTFVIGTGASAGQTQFGYCLLKAPTLTCKLSAPGDASVPADLKPEATKFLFTAKKR